MKKTYLKLSLTTAFVLSAVPALADSRLDHLQNLTQTEFNLLAKDFTAAASYKAVAPGAPLGVTGFDVGAELSVTQLENATIWKKAGLDRSSLPVPRLHIHKGLPLDIDVGASLTVIPDSNIKLIGGEISYAILAGGLATPSLSVRASGTRLSGVSQLDLDSKSLELTVSKGFLNFTPYAGVGRVWGSLTPNVANLKSVSPSENKLFAGVNVNFVAFDLGAELDRTGNNQTVSVKAGFRF